MGTRAGAAQLADVDDPLDRGGRIVEHFRVDASRRLFFALGLGSMVMAVGSLSMAAALYFMRVDAGVPLHARATPVEGVPASGPILSSASDPIELRLSWWEVMFGLVGLGSIAGGGGWAIARLNRVLREERYLALRTDGAYYCDEAGRSRVLWEDVADVRAEGDAVVFELHDGERWTRTERFAGASPEALAKRASEIRRKALFGLL